MSYYDAFDGPMTAEDDVRMMQNREQWPNPLLLPIKRYVGSLPECAVLAAYPGRETEVFLIGMFSIQGRVIDALDKTKTIKYDSYEAIVKDGWMVD